MSLVKCIACIMNVINTYMDKSVLRSCGWHMKIQVLDHTSHYLVFRTTITKGHKKQHNVLLSGGQNYKIKV